MTQALTELVVAFGLVTVVGSAARGQARVGLHLALTFWTAAGLLRLSMSASWMALAVAAIVIAVRQIVGRALG